MRSLLAVALSVGCVGFGAAGLSAQSFPAKPITLISPFAAGGTSDAAARAIAKLMTDRLGQQVVVVNRTGAGGTIGLGAAAASVPDGYTIAMGGLGSVVFTLGTYPKLAYDPRTQLTPIAPVAIVPTVVAVRSSLGVSTLGEFVVLARRQPDTLRFGSAGLGGTLHIAGEVFQRETGTRLIHIPYRGGAPAITDLLGGQIDVTFSDVTLVRPHVDSGKIRILAVAGQSRSPFLPDVPTTAESGFPRLELETWYALFAPAGVPSSVMLRLQEAVQSVMATTEASSALKAQGLTPLDTPPAAFAKQLDGEYNRWVPIIRQVCNSQCE